MGRAHPADRGALRFAQSPARPRAVQLAVVLCGLVPALGGDVGLTRDLRGVPRGGLGLRVRALLVAARDVVVGRELDRRIRRLPGRIRGRLLWIRCAILRRL